jgi:transcriptional regulator of acetoin/glycerol metabolism
MTTAPSHERPLAHVQALRARGAALPPEGVPGPDILDSWVRCMRAGLDAGLPMTPPVVETAELQRRREQRSTVRRLAQVELETLSQQIAGSNFLLAFADPDGVILDLYHDNRFTMSQDGAGIVAGSCWSEAVAGTNGLGTALALGRPVAVTGLEHYLLQLGQISCTAAPVRDASGEVVGVLDASSFFESRQRHTQALVQMAATQIENRLMVQQLQPHWVLAFHPRSEYLGTLSAGLAAFDDDGRLLALNARGRQMLQGLQALPGAHFDELFDEPFALAAARLVRQPELRLRDALGSRISVTCLSRPARMLMPAAAVRGAVMAGPPRASGADTVADTVAEAAAEAGRVRVARSERPTAGAATGVGAHEGDSDGAGRSLRSATPEPSLDDPAVQACYRMAGRAARLGVPVLIHGETGTGKELLARHVHASSGRRGAFVAVNCGAIPAELFEAELFGYAGGAYTGARREGSPGLIVSADGGTLLLDEVRELPLPLQAALLRFLDDRGVRPVGGTQVRPVDVQLVAATHADLDAEVAAGRFREDLLYRLNTVRLVLPALRARADFATCVAAQLHALDRRAVLEPGALERLQQHRWPGNFRELRTVLTRALLAADGARLEAAVFDAVLPTASAPAAGPRAADTAHGLRQRASELVRRELQRRGGSVSETARALGISRTTVYRHLKEAGAPQEGS